MEKRGVIEEGRTPREEPETKQAEQQPLEDHTTKRLADAVEDQAAKP